MLADRRNRRIVASAAFGVFQRLVQVGSTLIIMPLVLHALGASGFGVWGASASLAWMSGLVDIGTGDALVTLVARSMAKDQIEEARSQITVGLAIGSALCGVMLVVVMLGWMGGRLQGNTAPYLVALLGLALNIPLSSANNVWMALQKGYVSGFWELVQTVLTTCGLIAAAATSRDVRVYVAVVYAGLVLANLGSLMHLLLLHKEFRPRLGRIPREIFREVAGSGILFFLLGIAGGASFMLDNVLALQLLGPEASARMTIAMRICMTALGVLAVLSQPLWPAFTDAAHRSDRGWIRRTLIRSSALLAGATAVGSVILVLFGERLLHAWLHSSLGIERGLLLAISAWILAQALARVPCLLLNGLSLVRFQILVFSIASAIALGLKFTLAPHFGVSGILTATSMVVAFIVVPASAWRIYAWADHSARRDDHFQATEIAEHELSDRANQPSI